MLVTVCSGSELGLIIDMIRITMTYNPVSLIDSKHEVCLGNQRTFCSFNCLLSPFISLLNLNTLLPFSFSFKKTTVLNSFGGDNVEN